MFRWSLAVLEVLYLKDYPSIIILKNYQLSDMVNLSAKGVLSRHVRCQSAYEHFFLTTKRTGSKKVSVK